MERAFVEIVNRLLGVMGLDSSEDTAKTVAAMLVVTAVAVFAAVAVYAVTYVVSHRVTRLSASDYGTVIFARRNLKRLSFVFGSVAFYVLAPLAYDDGSARLVKFMGKMLDSLIVVAVIMLVLTLFRILFDILSHRENLKNRPLKGAFQVVQILTFLIGAILIVSILMGKSPSKLLTGLGAFAAVLSLIFKNTILGLVSGVMFSYEEMMAIGDWISMPRYEINGIVEEITLNTVKVRNFDNTVTTIPPYVLTSDAFRNWSWMLRSGARRIMRSVNVDMNSITFCSDELLDRLASMESMSGLVERLRAGDPAAPVAELGGLTGRPTNLALFRLYLLGYLESMPQLNRSMLYMVRELDPTETGLPLQIYMFSSVTAWVEYEKIQTSLFEHVIAMMPTFGLRPYQRISDNASGQDNA